MICYNKACEFRVGVGTCTAWMVKLDPKTMECEDFAKRDDDKK